MIVTYRQISQIKFPIFKLPSGNWYRTDGLLFLDGEILDDKNQVGETLGARRLQTPHENLMRLNSMISTHRGLIKEGHKMFIDSSGRPFIYEKTQYCTVKYLKIKQVDLKDHACLLWLQGVRQPFTTPRPPPSHMKWAGLLHLRKLPWMLYEYSEEHQKDKRRKV